MRISALTAMGLLLATAPAYAGFEVISPTTASQEVEMELQNTVRVGGVVLGEAVSEHEIGVNYGALEGWQIGMALGIENQRGSNPSVEEIEFSSKIGILGGETSATPQMFDLAIYSQFSFTPGNNGNKGETISVGPVMGFNFDSLTVVTNSFFVLPLGNSTPNTSFEYAVGGMVDVSDGLAVGFEAHGEVPSIFRGGSATNAQEHFIGPAVEVTFEPEEDREVGLRLGSFFGLTNAAPTVGLSANLELGF